MYQNKKKLLGLSLDQLRQIAKELDMPAFTGNQIAKWLYTRHVTDINQMTDLSKANRERLANLYEIGNQPPINKQASIDGTVKYLFPTQNGLCVETVFIPELKIDANGESQGDRATLCISSQIGCKMGCTFCQTGKQGFQGNLTTTDILNQIYALPEREQLTNIVMMGQGEPLDNIDNVLQATEIMTATWGYQWSPKRITVSTVGIKRGLQKFLEKSQCHLAISLHSPYPEQRASIMPAEHSMGIQQIVELLRQYDFSHQRRLSFEYILFGGLNDSKAHAKEIVKLLQGLDCRINLIKFHQLETTFAGQSQKQSQKQSLPQWGEVGGGSQVPNVNLPPTNVEQIENFRNYLTTHGIFTTIRASRGQDIDAACGMLSSKQINK